MEENSCKTCDMLQPHCDMASHWTLGRWAFTKWSFSTSFSFWQRNNDHYGRILASISKKSVLSRSATRTGVAATACLCVLLQKMLLQQHLQHGCTSHVLLQNAVETAKLLAK